MGGQANDPIARETLTLFGKALWRFAGNLTLLYGAWDGVFLTGDAAIALRPTLIRPEVRQSFAIAGPFAQQLRDVGAGCLLLQHAELLGAAEALRQVA